MAQRDLTEVGLSDPRCDCFAAVPDAVRIRCGYGSVMHRLCVAYASKTVTYSLQVRRVGIDNGCPEATVHDVTVCIGGSWMIAWMIAG